MVQILPKDDLYTEGSTHYGQYLSGWYTRLVPWTATFTSGAYSLKCGIGNIFSGYFGAGQSVPLSTQLPSRVGSFVKTLGTYGFQEICWQAARTYYAADCTARTCFSLFTLTGSPGVGSFKGAGVGVRISAGTYTETGQAERIADVTGYFFVLANDSAGAAMFYLLRVNTGTVTVLSSILATAVNPNWTMPGSVQVPRMLELTVSTNGGGNPVLTAKTGKIGAYQIGDPPGALTTVFNAFEDTSVSKITTAGRVAFGAYSDLDLGSGLKVTTAISFFEIVDTASGDTVHRDEFQRSNIALGRSVTDNNGRTGRWLACGWRGDLHCAPTTGDWRELARDAGNNRVASTVHTMDRLSSRPATSIYESHRSLVFNVAYVSGTVELALAARGGFLSTGNGAFVSGWKFALTYNGTVWAAKLTYYDAAGVAIPWCTLAIAVPATYSLNIAADNTLELEVKNIGLLAPEQGPTQLVAKLNGVTVTGWVVDAAVSSSTQVLATGEVITSSSAVALSGSVEGFSSVIPAGTVRADTWTDFVVPGTGTIEIPEEDQASIAMTSECTGKTGTLSCPHEWPVSIKRQAHSAVHEYDSGHRNRLLRSLRQRRRWGIQARASKPAERAALLSFFDSHKGVEIPFDWVTPDGETVSGRFDDPQGTLRYALIAPAAESFEIGIVEVFC